MLDRLAFFETHNTTTSKWRDISNEDFCFDFFSPLCSFDVGFDLSHHVIYISRKYKDNISYSVVIGEDELTPSNTT